MSVVIFVTRLQIDRLHFFIFFTFLLTHRLFGGRKVGHALRDFLLLVIGKFQLIIDIGLD
jgi:hypothetical protein